MKIKEKKNYKRERIMEAAISMFSENSFHEVMMEDVAKKALVAKGTLYNYFPSKENLYFSIMVTMLENLIAMLKGRIETEKESINALHLYVTNYYDFFVKNKCFFLMLQKENLNRVNELCDMVKSRQSELKDILLGILKSGKINNSLSILDEELACDFIIGALNGTVNYTLSNKKGYDLLTEKQGEILDYLMKGFFYNAVQDNNRILRNKTIVITRSVDESNETAEKLQELGAKVILFPTIEIVPAEDWRDFDRNIKEINYFDFLIFTSANAVKMFSKRCSELDIKVDYPNTKIAAVGKKTSEECKRNNIHADIVPEKFNSKGLLEELLKYKIKGNRIFIPGSAIAREELPGILRENGAEVVLVPVYNLGIPSNELLGDKIDILNKTKPDLFVFTSPSTFRNFLQIMNILEPQKYFGSRDIAVIGPTTKSEIENFGVNVNIIPDEYNIDGLIDSIISYYQQRQQ